MRSDAIKKGASKAPHRSLLKALGMTDEEIDKLINKNINFTTYGTNNEKGSGLGLMLCKDFIKLHNGELSINSKPGEGSTFSFTLPSGN